MSAIPLKARRRVDKRDGGVCVRCWGTPYDVHHRQRRRDGGHDVSNLIALCRGCHQFVHDNPRISRTYGWVVAANGRHVPSQIPVRRFGAWWLLNERGGAVEMMRIDALELLAAHGITRLVEPWGYDHAHSLDQA